MWAGVISRGLTGVDPPCQNYHSLWGLGPLPNSCIDFAFQSVLTLLPKHYLLLRSILHCYVAMDTFLIVDYTILVLDYIIVSTSLKIWAWLQLGHTQNLGVSA